MGETFDNEELQRVFRQSFFGEGVVTTDRLRNSLSTFEAERLTSFLFFVGEPAVIVSEFGAVALTMRVAERSFRSS